VNPKLSRRETEILQMMCAGMTLKEITYRLNLKLGTVSGYKLRLLLKTGCKNAAQLGVWAARNGLA
jgi:two-component system, NarL family, captular synthesis response regulator RcsB